MIDPITVLRAAEAGLPAAESHPDPPLACFPLRTDWEATLPAQMEDFPLPIIVGREPTLFGDPLPDSVLKLAEYAREHSWEVRTRYSQGNVPHGTTGKPSVLKDLIVLRFGAHPMTDRQAYAVYSRNAPGGVWTWTSVMIWGPDLPPYGGCGIEYLKDFLEVGSMRSTKGMSRWVADIRTLRTNQEAKRKERVKAAPKKSGTKEGLS